MLFIGKTLNAALFADCTLPLLWLGEKKTTINVKEKQKKTSKNAAYSSRMYSRIVVIKVLVAVLCLLNIHQMDYFTLLGLFYT